MNAHQKTAIAALNRAKGMSDFDLSRARRTFRDMSPEQMAEQYGESGRTRQEIVDCYEMACKDIDDAIEWVKAQK